MWTWDIRCRVWEVLSLGIVDIQVYGLGGVHPGDWMGNPRCRDWEERSHWALWSCDPRYIVWRWFHPGDCLHVTPGAGSGKWVTL